MHTVQLILRPTEYEKSVIDKRFHAVSHIHNVCVKHAKKLLIQLDHDKEYQSWRSEYCALSKQKDLSKADHTRKLELSKQMSARRQKIGLSKWALQSYIKVCGKRYSKLISSQQVQAEAANVWTGFEKCLFSKGKDIHFKKFMDFDTIGGKSNLNGARLDTDTMTVSWLGLELKCYLPKKASDRDYVLESLDHKISYCTIKRMMFSNGWRHYLVVTLDGDAPYRERKVKTGVMGIDPGVSTMAAVSDTACILEELAPDADIYEKQIHKLEQHMDASKRISNPDNFNSDGTVKKRRDCKPWVFSNSYEATRRKRKALYRKKSAYILHSHRNLCNRLLENADSFIVEKMDYAALAKRSSKTERQDKPTDVVQKDGTMKTVNKFKRKKRFGRSMNRRSPSRFLSELKRKAESSGGAYAEVNTQIFKASQYNHVADECVKVPLSQRFKLIGNDSVQRDLYSAFLIKNTDSAFEHPDRDKCIYEFESFVAVHNETINYMKESKISMKQCFGF